MKRVFAQDARLELLQRPALIAPAHFAQAHDAFVGDDFENGTQEIAGMDAGVVAQLRVERDGHAAGAQVNDFHSTMSFNLFTLPFFTEKEWVDLCGPVVTVAT